VLNNNQELRGLFKNVDGQLFCFFPRRAGDDRVCKLKIGVLQVVLYLDKV